MTSNSTVTILPIFTVLSQKYTQQNSSNNYLKNKVEKNQFDSISSYSSQLLCTTLKKGIRSMHCHLVIQKIYIHSLLLIRKVNNYHPYFYSSSGEYEIHQKSSLAWSYIQLCQEYTVLLTEVPLPKIHIHSQILFLSKSLKNITIFLYKCN